MKLFLKRIGKLPHNFNIKSLMLHIISKDFFIFSEKQTKIVEFIWNKLKNKSWKKVLKVIVEE